MKTLHHLKRQMRVVANPRHIPGSSEYHLRFVGAGRRRLFHAGWWKTQLNFHTLDFSAFGQYVRINGKKKIWRPSHTVMLYAPNVSFEEYYETTREFRCLWILFSGNAKNGPLSSSLQREGYCLFQDEKQLIPPLITAAADIASPDRGARWRAQAAFLEILAHLHQSSPAKRNKGRILGAMSAPPKNAVGFREKVRRVLRANPHCNYSVGEFSRLLDMSRSSFSHRFSREIGETWVQLKNRARVERAQMLISNTDKSLKQISYETGFKDPAYFSRIFQSIAGLSPRNYSKLSKIKGA